MTKFLNQIDKSSENAFLYWDKYQDEQDKKSIQKMKEIEFVEPDELEKFKWSNNISRSGERDNFRMLIEGYCCARPDATYEEVKDFINKWQLI